MGRVVVLEGPGKILEHSRERLSAITVESSGSMMMMISVGKPDERGIDKKRSNRGFTYR